MTENRKETEKQPPIELDEDELQKVVAGGGGGWRRQSKGDDWRGK